jgi:acyl dehydratase
MKIKPGDTASLSKTITDNDIRAFAEVSGDQNPLHLDEHFAKQTRFGRRVAHGMLGASLISAVIARTRKHLSGTDTPVRRACLSGRYSRSARYRYWNT